MDARQVRASALGREVVGATESAGGISPVVISVCEEIDQALQSRFEPVPTGAGTDDGFVHLRLGQDLVKAARPREAESENLAVREFLVKVPFSKLPIAPFGESGSAPGLLALYGLSSPRSLTEFPRPQRFTIELHNSLDTKIPVFVATWHIGQVASTLDVDAWGKTPHELTALYVGALFRAGATLTIPLPQEFLMDGRRWLIDNFAANRKVKIASTPKELPEKGIRAKPGRLEYNDDLPNISVPELAARSRAERELQVGQLLGELAGCQETLDITRERMNSIVSDARNLNVTWTVIGEALGIRGETAYQRFTERGRDSQRQKSARRRTRETPGAE